MKKKVVLTMLILTLFHATMVLGIETKTGGQIETQLMGDSEIPLSVNQSEQSNERFNVSTVEAEVLEDTITTVEGDWISQDGIVSVTQGNDAKAIIDGASYSNLEFSALISVGNQTTTSDAGLFFRASNVSTGTNALKGYYVGIDANADRLLLGRMDNNWKTLKIVNTHISADYKYRITVVANGNNIKVYKYDDLLIDYTDSEPILSAGAVGFRANKTSAQFEEVQHGIISSLSVTSGNWSTLFSPLRYSVTQGQDDKAVMSSYGNYKNLEYTARIKVARSDATSDAGIIFRASNISTGKNALTGYYVGIDASQKRLYLGKLRNNWTNLTTIVMDNITANQYYKITVVAVEDNIKVYMDDVLKINVKDTDNPILSSGAVGFRANQTAAEYHQVKVSDPPPVQPEQPFTDYQLSSTNFGNWSASGSNPRTYSVTQGEDSKATIDGYSYRDFRYSAYVKVGRNDASSYAGLIFRASNLSAGYEGLTGYFVGIDAYSKVLRFRKVVNGNILDNESISVNGIKSNQYYKITVEALVDNIKIYVDDVLKIDYTDATDPIVSSGYIGFRAYRTAAEFTKVRHEKIILSDDATLSYFRTNLTHLTMEPKFDPQVTTYSLRVPSDINYLYVEVKPNHPNATTSDTSSPTLDTGYQRYLKLLNMGTNTAKITVTAHDGFTQKTYTLIIKRGYQATVNHYFDRGFYINQGIGATQATAASFISQYQSVAHNVFLGHFDLNIQSTYPQFYESPPDLCSFAGPTVMCEVHNPPCSAAETLVSDAFNRFGGSDTTTTVVWSNNYINNGSMGTAGTFYNRDFSSPSTYGIFMLTRSKDIYEIEEILVHELSHQFGARDHYHEILANGTCRGGLYCSNTLCNPYASGRSPRPASCIMNGELKYTDIQNFQQLFCDGCKGEIQAHLNDHH